MLRLVRVQSSDKGTYGVLFKNDMPVCVTRELPWRDNAKYVSCIPTGSYKCRKIKSVKYGTVIEVLNVPSRTSILIHAGNYLRDSLGCIVVVLVILKLFILILV